MANFGDYPGDFRLFQALRLWGRRESVGRAKMGAVREKRENEGRKSV